MAVDCPTQIGAPPLIVEISGSGWVSIITCPEQFAGVTKALPVIWVPVQFASCRYVTVYDLAGDDAVTVNV